MMSESTPTGEPPELANRLVVITGVGQRGQVGEAIARAFAERGAEVALMDVAEEAVRERARELREAGFVATAHAGDLRDAIGAEAQANEILAAHPNAGGKVYALINAAGGFAVTGPLDESDPSSWRHQFTISADTAYAATRAFLPALRAGRGSVVFFASAAALAGSDVGAVAAYTGAKSAVVALMRSVAQAEREHGVRANAVAPTAIRTASNVADMGESENYVSRESVADVLLFLCSDAARNVSGEVIRLA